MAYPATLSTDNTSSTHSDNPTGYHADLHNDANAAINQIVGILGSTSVVIPARMFEGTTSGATSGILGASGQNMRFIQYDATTQEGAMALTSLPMEWATFDVHVYWTAALNTGGVAWRLDLSPYKDGTSIDANESPGSDTIATVPATALVLKRTTVRTGVNISANLDPVDRLVRIELIRLAPNSQDTLAGDASVAAVVLTRAS